MRRITVLVSLVSLVVALAPLPASAQATDLACPAAIVPDAGFTDVDPGSVHEADIDCIVFWGISTGTTPTTFDPKGEVTRWQMALFLIRTFNHWAPDAVDGSDQGFTELVGDFPETDKAINQLKQLSITSGTTPTTFSPNGTVSRWQMALFLTRFLRAMGVTLPNGADQGFGDISGFNVETQVAINQLKQLGVTAGTTASAFSPNAVVTREQMASFIARTLQATRELFLLAWGPAITCDSQGLNCVYSATFAANTGFFTRPSRSSGPLPVQDPNFFTNSLRKEITLDGNPVPVVQKVVTLNDVVFKYFEASYITGLTGFHTIVITSYEDDQVLDTFTLQITFTE